MDEKIREIEKLQAELAKRTEVENKAIKLIEQCRFDEALEVLKSI